MSAITETMCIEDERQKLESDSVVGTKKWPTNSKSNEYDRIESNEIYNYYTGSESDGDEMITNAYEQNNNNNNLNEAETVFSNEENAIKHDVNDIEETLPTQEARDIEGDAKVNSDDKKSDNNNSTPKELTNSKLFEYRAVKSNDIDDNKSSIEMVNKKVMKLSERRKHQRLNKNKKVTGDILDKANINATLKTAAKKFLQNYSRLRNNSKFYKVKRYIARSKIKKMNERKYKSTAIPRRIKTVFYSKENIEDVGNSLDNDINKDNDVTHKRKYKKIFDRIHKGGRDSKKKFVRMNKKHTKNAKKPLDIEELLKNMTKSSIIDDITEYLLDNVMRKYENKIRIKYNNMKDVIENPIERFEIIL